MARRLVFLAVCATVATLVGCGGGDSTSTSSTSASASTSTTVAESSEPVTIDALGASVTESTAGEHGLVVQSVQSENIRLRVGDVIISLDGHPVGSPEEMIKEVANPAIGDSYTIEVVRGDKHFTLTEVASPNAYLGAQIKDAKGGVAVVDVEPGGPAEKAGIQSGDLMTAIDDVRTPDSDTLLHTLATHRPGDTVTVTLDRGSDTLSVKATLTEHP